MQTITVIRGVIAVALEPVKISDRFDSCFDCDAMPECSAETKKSGNKFMELCMSGGGGFVLRQVK